jgi:hypothetical protein
LLGFCPQQSSSRSALALAERFMQQELNLASRYSLISLSLDNLNTSALESFFPFLSFFYCFFFSCSSFFFHFFPFLFLFLSISMVLVRVAVIVSMLMVFAGPGGEIEYPCYTLLFRRNRKLAQLSRYCSTTPVQQLRLKIILMHF